MVEIAFTNFCQNSASSNTVKSMLVLNIVGIAITYKLR